MMLGWIGLDSTSLLIRVNRRRYFQNAWPEVIRHYAFYLQELLLKISERFIISPEDETELQVKSCLDCININCAVLKKGLHELKDQAVLVFFGLSRNRDTRPLIFPKYSHSLFQLD